MTSLLNRNSCALTLFVMTLSFTATATYPSAWGQDTPSVQSTDLIVDGNVENVFQSGDESLVQILVQRSEVPRLDALTDATYPAPGQFVYAHAGDARSGLSRLGRNRALPKPNARIRAYLSVGRSGQWQASGDDWYQENPSDEIQAAGGSPQPGAAGIGITAQRVNIGRQTALKVTGVTPGSPAANAGIETGDILVEANRVALESESQLATAYRDSRGEFSLTVRDVRTGRDVLVQVAAGSPGTAPSNREMQPLGATTELAFYDGQAVVKVTEVTPNSPAARSGLKAGLLILKANGTLIESPKDLTAAEQASRGRMELVVVDPKEKRERTVRVSL
ncbi:PDZ domain-containing protein [Stieleria sp. TO1_6]|uniref:PDZ domain-containing protein n=1 Tax=Stieleria tagensis TaxID=2956795 RepID=UPI00209AE7A2|nr:PDZ domain-containing protein [Stieleria tagensis]MCO8124465.1 PDZ domain-containing protein [Stieleria tagensis]